MEKPILRCGKRSKTMYYPFLAPVFCFFDSLALFLLHDKWKKHVTLILFFLYLGEFLCGAVLQTLTVYFNPSSTQETPLTLKIRTSKFIFVQAKHAHLSKLNYLLVLIPAFIYTISLFLMNYNGTLFPYQITKTTVIVIQILFASLLCKLVFKVNYFKHNFWSFILILIGFAIGLGSDYECFLGQWPTYLGWNISLFSLGFFLFTIAETMDKWLMEKRFLTPQILLIIEGFIGVVVFLSMMGVFSYTKCEGLLAEALFCNPVFQLDQIESFGNFKELSGDINLLYLFIVMISSSLFQAFSKYTNYHYWPTHRTLSDLLSCLFSVLFIEIAIVQVRIGHKIGFVVGFIFIIFGALLYNEFIISGLFGLDENTKEMIDRRITLEEDILNEDLNSIENDDNDIATFENEAN